MTFRHYIIDEQWRHHVTQHVVEVEDLNKRGTDDPPPPNYNRFSKAFKGNNKSFPHVKTQIWDENDGELMTPHPSI